MKNKPFRHLILLIGFGKRTFAFFYGSTQALLRGTYEAANESGVFRLSYQ